MRCASCPATGMLVPAYWTLGSNVGSGAGDAFSKAPGLLPS